MAHVKSNHEGQEISRKNLTIEKSACFQKQHFLEGRNVIYHGRKNKIRAEYARRYRKAKKTEKTKILDEYLKLLGGGNRKYAIFALNREGKKQLRLIDGENVNVIVTSRARRKRVYQKYYDDELAQALSKLWKLFLHICGERLVPMLRANLDSISRKRRFRMSPEVKQKLSTISRTTVERLLAREQQKHRLKGKSTTKKGSLLKN